MPSVTVTRTSSTTKKFASATSAIGGYVFKNEMTSQGESTYVIGERARDQQIGLNIRTAANANSAVLAVLPAGAQVRIAPSATHSKYHKLLEIISPQSVPPLTAEQLADSGYIWKDSLIEVKEPQAVSTVFNLAQPIEIKAGDLIGHLGKYQAASQGAPEDLLHLEVFACEDVEAFITKSRDRAKQLKPEQRSLLKIPTGIKVITKADASKDNPPKPSDPGQATTYDMVLPLAVLNALPASDKISITSKAGGVTTTEQWWKLSNLPGPDGNPISGWVKEDEIMTPRLHPWDWEGFDFIKETSTISDQYACKLDSDGVLDDGEKTNYQAQISKADSGPIKTRLYDLIDLNKDEKLTPSEIRNALAKPWHAQSISRLITHYESEWYADASLSKWEALNCYMTQEDEKNWAQEKERIKELTWMEEVLDEGISSSGYKHKHIQLISILSQFSMIRRRRDNNLGSLSSAYETGGRGSITVSGGSGDAGGVSYGSYQMTSKVTLPNGTVITGGTVKNSLHGKSFHGPQSSTN